NVVTGDNTTEVTVSIASGDDGLLGGTQTVTASAGVVTFSSLTLSGLVSETYTFAFAAEIGRASCRERVKMSASAAAFQKTNTTQPVGGASGSVLGTQPVFLSRGGRHTMFSRDWSSDVCSSDLSGDDGLLGGTQTVTASAGVVTFSSLTLSGLVSETYTFAFAA